MGLDHHRFLSFSDPFGNSGTPCASSCAATQLFKNPTKTNGGIEALITHRGNTNEWIMDERTSLNKRWDLNNWRKTWAAVEAESQDRSHAVFPIKTLSVSSMLHLGPPYGSVRSSIHGLRGSSDSTGRVLWNTIGKRHPLQSQSLVAVRWAWWFFIESVQNDFSTRPDRWQILIPGFPTHLTLSFATQQQSRSGFHRSDYTGVSKIWSQR